MNCKAINKEPISDITIRFQDCDPFGHLNNARYIDYFINAREDHLAEYYDFDIYKRQKQLNTNWVVTKTKIAYLYPVFFNGKVSIKTTLIKYTKNSLLMEGTMLDSACKNFKSVILVKFRYFDLTDGKPIIHSDELKELFNSILIKNMKTDNFDVRVKEITYS